MVNCQVTATQRPDGAERIEIYELVPGGLFRKATSRLVPRSEWPRLAPKATLSALALARTLAASSDLAEDENGIAIPFEVAARLDEKDASALGLPPATNLTLQLRSTGSLADGSIQIQSKWVRRGGVPVRAKRDGGRVREGDRTGRLAEPLLSAAVAAEQVNQAVDPDARRAAFAAFRGALGEDIARGIDADGFIERIRVAYAANFSLDAKTSGGRFDFDPVLFGRQAIEAEDGELIDASHASLLTPQESVHFQSRFRAQDGSRRSYLMPDGTLLFLDPLLGRALEVVRQKQKAPSQERRDFLRAPQRHLREALSLDDLEDDAAADRLFIETRQFSERVSGIEVWHKPVLPWIQPKPNSWLPEAFGLRVGNPPDEQYIELEPGDAAVIAREVAEAMARGEDNVAWRDESLPATSETLRSVEGIAELEREISGSNGEAKETDGPREALQTFFLQVGQNFETLDYTRLPQPDAENAPFEVPQLPASIISGPKPHQLEGFAWLAEAWTRKLPGVLLADDMGLGKTFQALMFLQWLRAEAAPERPILIVAPTGLLRNWQAEIAQHLARNSLGPRVEAFGGVLSRYRTGPGNDVRGGTTRLYVDEWEEAGVVLTTYETMRDYHMSFARIRFAAIVFDEVQKLKNPASQMTRAAKALNADIQLAMTGTPVENRLQDLWSIADTVFPGFLGTSREFETSYPATDRDSLAALQSLLIDRTDGLPPFMLRRMKDEILTGLPVKTARKYHVDMPQAQAEAYDRVLARARALRQSGEKGAMLKVLHMLRGTSLHPEPPHAIADIDGYVARSARLQKTFEILGEIRAAGEKALVFCEDLEMQAFLAMAIQERFQLPRPPACISGLVAGPRRQEIVNAFQTERAGFDVLILSPKAGGVGLTITSANHVIHLSRWWNPAVEDQATDRVYRIGQLRPVTVHIPVAVHPDPAIAPSSFDRRLDDLMERKRALSRGLLVPPESDDDVEELLADVLDGRACPQAAVNEVGSAPASAPRDVPATGDVDGGEEIEAGSDGPTASSMEETQHTEGTASRPVLKLRETPLEVAERRTPSIRRVQYEQYGLRDWAIFDQFIEGAEIIRLEIQDPYCCADDAARGRLVNFVKRFEQNAARLDRVEILAFDADSVDSHHRETTKEQRDELERRWNATIGDTDLRLVQRSRRANGDLHDRFVRAHLRAGDHVIWDLGRGIDGVMNAKWACVVNAFHQPAPS
ncbi:Superfamily II DNA or RNA helicase, SNF2 family [Sphingobium faniae]|nr:Superfamily II DNA or RNA helicase, SNF2 family [Sphingobium faniae]